MSSSIHPHATQTGQHACEHEDKARGAGRKRPEDYVPEDGRSRLDTDPEYDVYGVRVTGGLASKMRRRDPEVDVESDKGC